MLINWFTVVAQIINFLILVGLLRWFLYQPILQVIEKRKAVWNRNGKPQKRPKQKPRKPLITTKKNNKR